MPGDPGELAVNTRVHTHYQYAHTRLRVQRAPGIPHALFGREILATARAHRAARGENACVDWTTVIARSAATKQSILPLLRYGLLRSARNDDFNVNGFNVKTAC